MGCRDGLLIVRAVLLTLDCACWSPGHLVQRQGPMGGSGVG